jgi:hypothetical protein
MVERARVVTDHRLAVNYQVKTLRLKQFLQVQKRLTTLAQSVQVARVAHHLQQLAQTQYLTL